MVFIVLGLALYAVWYGGLHWAASSAASLLVCGCAALCRAPAGNVRRLCYEAGRWRLEMDSGNSVEVHPQGDSVVLPFLVVLRVRLAEAERVCTLVLAADAYPAERWRSLQLNLRQSLSASYG